MTNYAKLYGEVMSGFETSYWLKGAVLQLIGRDPVDALADAKLLAKLAAARVKNLEAGIF